MTTPKQPKWIIVLVPSNPKDLDFLLETIEEIDPDIRWRHGELPTELDKHFISTYIWYQTKDSTLCTSPQSHLATCSTTNNVTHKDTASFLNHLKSFKYVNNHTSNPSPIPIPNGAHASKQPPTVEWLTVAAPGLLLRNTFFRKIEKIDPTIKWGSGETPTGIDASLIEGYIWYHVSSNILCTSPQSYLATCRTNKNYDNAHDFLAALKALKPTTQMLTTSSKVSSTSKSQSKWNCKCSRCKEDAYQSPFSFECENGCQGATGIGKNCQLFSKALQGISKAR